MDAEAIKKMFNELYPHLEAMETQTNALLRFLTAKGIVKDEEFAPFLEESGNASYVKWLTTRLRIEHALSTSTEENDKPAEISTKPPAQEPEDKRVEHKEARQASERAANNADREGGNHEAENDNQGQKAGQQLEKDAAQSENDAA